MAALTTAGLLAQPDAPPAPSVPPAATAVPELTPDMDDPNVIRAQRDLDRVKLLIGQGAIPAMRLRAAQEDLQNALDMSILRANLFGKDLLPEQADQMVAIAQKMVLRRQRSMIEMQQLVSSGVISRSEAEASGADFDRAQTELHLAETRARLMQQMAE
jgi:multidrug resistance efflux pump